MNKTILTLLVISNFVFLNSLSQENRSLMVEVRTSEGKTINLYRNSYALIIGNGDYCNGWDLLPGAIQDVGDVSKALKRNGFEVIKETNITNKSAFNKIFAEFVFKYGQNENDRLLFYFAGHGHTLKMANNENLGYIVMINAPDPKDDPVGFEETSVDMEALITHAKKIKARHVLFMFDCCFSGTILNMRDNIIPQAISNNIVLKGRQFITAGRADEIVPDKSVFKEAFLDLIMGRDEEPILDGYVTGSELGLYLKIKVPEYNPAQNPQYGTINDPKLNKGDFVFVVATPYMNKEVNLGMIYVRTEPWCYFTLDGKEVYTSPFFIEKLSFGTHELVFSRPYYKKIVKTIILSEDRPYVKVFERLKRE